MSAFIPALRGALLWLSRQQGLRQWMETAPAARPLTQRFVAGMELDDAISAARQLQQAGFLASLDYLGENVTSLSEAEGSLDNYKMALHRIHFEVIEATVSMKVTSLGLDLSEQACLEKVQALVLQAHQTRTRVEFDMEDSSYTDRNLKLVRAMHSKMGSVRAVIQAYLYRSDRDVDILCEEGIPVRLCKGAYRELPSIAWQEKSEVDRNYVMLMDKLFDRGTFPAIATHDATLVEAAIAQSRSRGLSAEDFEFQMLYGVQRRLQRNLIERGFRVRVYVPYGRAWYPYFMRRLAERPANVAFLLRSLLQG
ncbi:MAG: proline dehydrogenase family protein [Bryobacteraceae bacterium]